MVQITQGQLGPVTYTVYVNGVLYNQQPPVLDAQLVEEYESHQMLYLRIEYPPTIVSVLSQQSLWTYNTPIQVVWGRSPDTRTFYGYINHHEIAGSADSGTEAMQLTYVCIGTSAVMNSAKTRQWENVSSTYIASKIARENNLRPVTSPSSTVLTYEAQAGESDFQFLKRMADKTGLRFHVSGGSLYMISPTQAIQGAGSSAPPVFTHNKAIGTLDTCRNFHQLKGANLPGAVQANRVIYGIDSSTGQQFAASTAPGGSTSRVAIKTTFASTNYADAKARVNAWSALSQFWTGAQAQLYGTTSIYPGKLVQLTGAAMPDNTSGYWLISHVTHSLVSSNTGTPNLDTYIADVIMIRNTQQGSAGTLANVSPVSPEFTTMNLNTNGQWVTQSAAPVMLPS